MSHFRGYWWGLYQCPAASACWFQGFIRSRAGGTKDCDTASYGTGIDDGAGGTLASTSVNGVTVTGSRDDITGATKTTVEAVYPNKIGTFPIQSLRSWWDGSGWWPSYPEPGPINYAILDQILTGTGKLPTNAIVCNDCEFAEMMPGHVNTDANGVVSYEWTEEEEDRALAQIKIMQDVYRYIKAARPDITYLVYMGAPFQDANACAFYVAGSTYGGYANVFRDKRLALKWSINNGYGKGMWDAFVVSAYSLYDGVGAETNLPRVGYPAGSSTARSLWSTCVNEDMKTLARIGKPVYLALTHVQANSPTNYTQIADDTLKHMLDTALGTGDGIVLWSSSDATVLRAAYNAGTAYTQGDVVTHNGKYYMCLTAGTGNTPANNTFWHETTTNPNHWFSWAGNDGPGGTRWTNVYSQIAGR